MRTRVALAVGFGFGYYLGAKAGRERYEQLHKLVSKLDALGRLGVERLRLGVERLRPSEEGDVVPLRPAAGAGEAQPSSR